jgi:beta-glucosidase
LYETYLPHFEAAVREGHVGIVMAAYNAVYGKPSSASSFLLTDILRNRWRFCKSAGGLGKIRRGLSKNLAVLRVT